MPMHKCENCGDEVHWRGRKQRGERCVGWVGSLQSRWGKKYDRRSGRAWWCPKKECQRANDLACLEKVMPNAGMSTLEYLLDQAELQKLREN